jgi:PAS domain S-box-containing protein
MIETFPLAQPAASQQLQDPLDQLPVACIDLSADGKVARANLLGCAIFQMKREELIGMGAWELMATEEVEMSRAAFFAVIHSNEDPPPIRRTFYAKNGEYHTYDMFRARILDSQGQTVGLRYILIDITKTEHEQKELAQKYHWQESMLASVSEAIIAFDALGFICYVNPAAEKLSGCSAQDLIGQLVEKKLPLQSFASLDENPLSHRAQLDKPCKGTATVLNGKGEAIPLEICTSPILDKQSGSILGVVSVVRQRTGAS